MYIFIRDRGLFCTLLKHHTHRIFSIAIFKKSSGEDSSSPTD